MATTRKIDPTQVEKTPVTIYLTEDLRRRVKVVAAERGSTMSEVVTAALLVAIGKS